MYMSSTTGGGDMYDRAIAQERVNDLVRAAEADRLARRARRARAAERGTIMRRMGNAVTAALLWPIRR